MNSKIKLLIIVSLFILIYIVPSQACIVNWLAHNETYISLKNTNKSFDVNKVKESLGKDYFNEQNDSITFNCVNGENCTILISKKEMIYNLYNIKKINDMYYIYNMTDKEIYIELNKNKELANKTCHDHLTWIKSINATNLDEMDIDQICKVIDLQSYVDYGHKNQYDAEYECVDKIIGNYSVDHPLNRTLFNCIESCREQYSHEKCEITINLTSSQASECPPGYKGVSRTGGGGLEYLVCRNEDCFIKKKIDCYCGCDPSIKECYGTIFKDKWVSLSVSCVIENGEIQCYKCGDGGAGKFFGTPKNTRNIINMNASSNESESRLTFTEQPGKSGKVAGFGIVLAIIAILIVSFIGRK